MVQKIPIRRQESRASSEEQTYHLAAVLFLKLKLRQRSLLCLRFRQAWLSPEQKIEKAQSPQAFRAKRIVLGSLQ